jgi:hypothetical protein
VHAPTSAPPQNPRPPLPPQLPQALHDGQYVDAHFTRSFYKHLLGQPLTYEDIEAVDPDFFKNLAWMLGEPCIPPALPCRRNCS